MPSLIKICDGAKQHGSWRSLLPLRGSCLILCLGFAQTELLHLSLDRPSKPVPIVLAMVSGH